MDGLLKIKDTQHDWNDEFSWEQVALHSIENRKIARSTINKYARGMRAATPRHCSTMWGGVLEVEVQLYVKIYVQNVAVYQDIN